MAPSEKSAAVGAFTAHFAQDRAVEFADSERSRSTQLVHGVFGRTHRLEQGLAAGCPVSAGFLGMLPALHMTLRLRDGLEPLSMCRACYG
ncbi:hypothetical protein AK812_SmicGene42419 [Symbiodinium microadriaticum]|uniref:Uncharacterized protein n=1 Tax=Symbiodinium microadriaticum TaxID=2951 RepID=A0A1Q9C3L7_SYMMI|nr:hypothetical protein AK812_SmicGene42419 [Symbiodinium microadriaticum]